MNVKDLSYVSFVFCSAEIIFLLHCRETLFIRCCFVACICHRILGKGDRNSHHAINALLCIPISNPSTFSDCSVHVFDCYSNFGGGRLS